MSETSVDTIWARILPRLNALDGFAVYDELEALRESKNREEIKLFNALYWRVDFWLQLYFARKPFTPDETKQGFTKSDVGQQRFLQWRETHLNQPAHKPWNSEELKFILSKLSKTQGGDHHDR